MSPVIDSKDNTSLQSLFQPQIDFPWPHGVFHSHGNLQDITTETKK